MTISYTAQVATSSFSCFLKLLARWRGSIYKLLWKDFGVFAGLYFILSFLYRFVFNEQQRRTFEMISIYCESNNALIPVAFILGFYVTQIMSRYWNCLSHIPWPDHMAMFVTANVQGLDDRSRMMRRTMLRYLCLAYAMTMAAISPTVKKRFPSLDHMVDAGLLTANEKTSLDNIRTPHNKFFIPLAWTTRLACKARKERRIEDEFALKTLIDEINQFRMHLATLFVYDWITVPLVYTQVVTLAVYMFFLAALMGRQFIQDSPDAPDMYFPLFTFLEYFFYMGWLKVAECLVNPFGEDEEDFDVNFLIDRNLQVSYIIVDEVYNEPPDLVRDQYWNETHFEMPYTAEAEPFRKQPHLGSAVDIRSAKDFDLGTTAREEMEPIEEADSLEELDPELAEGSRPSRGIFQTPMAIGGSVLKRIFSRQESRSYGRSSVAIPMAQRGESRSSSVAASADSHQPPDDLQFHMEDDNQELDADDKLLIEESERKASIEGTAMRKTKSATQRHSKDFSGSSPSKTVAHMEHRPETSTKLSSSPETKLEIGKGSTIPTASDPEKDIIDLTSATAQQEIHTSSGLISPITPEPTSPTCPESASSVWVLASSRFNLATNDGNQPTRDQQT